MFNVFNEFIDLIEFNIIYSKSNNNFRIVDRQGGNLANIESERFSNLTDILNRLGAYINDYIINDIMSELSINGHKTYRELINIIVEKRAEDHLKLDLLVLDMLDNLNTIDDFKNIEMILQHTILEQEE